LPADEVFFTFQDNEDWGSIGLACLVGILGPTVTLVGGDSAVHLGEETKEASRALPIAMTATAAVNYIIGFIMTITILSVSGNFDANLATRTGQPYVAVIYAATGSRSATIAFLVIIIILFFCCTINCITTTSRQLYAFSRDGGVPFSQWISKVRLMICLRV
jgi:choline transport protein